MALVVRQPLLSRPRLAALPGQAGRHRLALARGPDPTEITLVEQGTLPHHSVEPAEQVQRVHRLLHQLVSLLLGELGELA